MMVLSPESNQELPVEEIMSQEVKPVWYGEDHGWNGGSHNDAQLFCTVSGKKELCPYVSVR